MVPEFRYRSFYVTGVSEPVIKNRFQSTASELAALKFFFAFYFLFFTFCPIFAPLQWRDAGVAELARLESGYTPKGYRGFESPSLRLNRKIACLFYRDAIFLCFHPGVPPCPALPICQKWQ